MTVNEAASLLVYTQCILAILEENKDTEGVSELKRRSKQYKKVISTFINTVYDGSSGDINAALEAHMSYLFKIERMPIVERLEYCIKQMKDE